MGKGAFDTILKLDTDDGDDPNSTEPQGTSSPADPESKKSEDSIKKLQSELDKANSLIEAQSKKIDKLSGNTDVINKMRDVFVPKDPDPDQIHKEELANHDLDPISTINKIVDKQGAITKEELKIIHDELNSLKSNLAGKEITKEVDREYEVDWAKDSNKIIEQLNTFDPAWRKANRKTALIRAIELAGVGKKREELPFIDNTSSHILNSKQAKTYADKIKEGVMGYSRKSRPKTAFDLLPKK